MISLGGKEAKLERLEDGICRKVRLCSTVVQTRLPLHVCRERLKPTVKSM